MLFIAFQWRGDAKEIARALSWKISDILVSVVKFIAERGLAFRNGENVGSPGEFFHKVFETLFKQILKRCDASNDWFCNSFTNR